MKGLLAATVFSVVYLYGQTALDHLQQADAFLARKDYASSANEYRNTINTTLNFDLQIRAHLGLTRIFETTGQRERALTEMHQIERLQSEASARRSLPVGVYRAGEDATQPEPIESEQPGYTPEALLAELEGTVLITAIIGIDGTSSAAQISRAIGLGLDEKALEALAAWRFRPGTSGGKPVPVMAIIPVEFRIAPKTSRWHLTGVTFHLAQGVERPHILSPKFPEGPGVSAREAMEEGSLLRAIRREAMAVVLFDIDESGVPVHLAIESASAEVWAPEALAVVRGWRFQPGMKEDQPVSVPCTFTLTWGGLKLAAN